LAYLCEQIENNKEQKKSFSLMGAATPTADSGQRQRQQQQ